MGQSGACPLQVTVVGWAVAEPPGGQSRSAWEQGEPCFQQAKGNCCWLPWALGKMQFPEQGPACNSLPYFHHIVESSRRSGSC